MNVVPPQANHSQESLAQVFGDPEMARSASEDPVLKFLVSAWRQMTVIVLGVLAVFYATNVFRETRERDLQSSGDAFYRVQRQFDAYKGLLTQIASLQGKTDAEIGDKGRAEIAELEKRRDETRKKIEDALAALADMRAPFDSLASLYRGLLSREAGDTAGLVNAINPRAWAAVNNTSSAERFMAEIQSLAYARALIDSEAHNAEALAVLKELASQGAYVHTSAALAVAAVANTPEDRKAALDLLIRLQATHPEQSELVDDEIARLR